jgi:hypothetical protein
MRLDGPQIRPGRCGKTGIESRLLDCPARSLVATAFTSLTHVTESTQTESQFLLHVAKDNFFPDVQQYTRFTALLGNL